VTYIVDRIEEDIAVLQDEQEALHPLPLTALPDGVRPGDVVQSDGDGYRLDPAATAARRERIRHLQDRLRRR